MLNFCTLFDSNYAPQGLSMYNSLFQHCKDFHLYIFAFDDITFEVFRKLHLSKATIISLVDFEDEELLRAKQNRSKKEYCWTCASSTILYCLKRYNLDQCAYIDADLYFYSDITVLIDETADKSVLITPHNYAPEYDQSENCGKYCVQFISFKNNADGMNALNWWRKACLEWCYARFEDGKFGDQKYLDDWLERFNCVHVLKNFGGGLAPWNRTRYYLDRHMQVNESGKKYPLCFYHFHDLKFDGKKINRDYFLNYKIDRKYMISLYVPYVKELILASKKLHKLSPKITQYSLWNILEVIKLFFDNRKKNAKIQANLF